MKQKIHNSFSRFLPELQHLDVHDTIQNQDVMIQTNKILKKCFPPNVTWGSELIPIAEIMSTFVSVSVLLDKRKDS